jgi:hypothetical protein
MDTNEKKKANSLPQHPRREFLTKGASMILGTMAITTLGIPGLNARDANWRKKKEDDSFQIFDCHLHCPAEAGEKWQWHKVTNNFGEFVNYLDKCGIQRGIINSQRSYDESFFWWI